jgi:hypothetical protein
VTRLIGSYLQSAHPVKAVEADEGFCSIRLLVRQGFRPVPQQQVSNLLDGIVGEPR